MSTLQELQAQRANFISAYQNHKITLQQRDDALAANQRQIDALKASQGNVNPQPSAPAQPPQLIPTNMGPVPVSTFEAGAKDPTMQNVVIPVLETAAVVGAAVVAPEVVIPGVLAGEALNIGINSASKSLETGQVQVVLPTTVREVTDTALLSAGLSLAGAGVIGGVAKVAPSLVGEAANPIVAGATRVGINTGLGAGVGAASGAVEQQQINNTVAQLDKNSSSLDLANQKNEAYKQNLIDATKNTELANQKNEAYKQELIKAFDKVNAIPVANNDDEAQRLGVSQYITPTQKQNALKEIGSGYNEYLNNKQNINKVLGDIKTGNAQYEQNKQTIAQDRNSLDVTKGQLQQGSNNAILSGALKGAAFGAGLGVAGELAGPILGRVSGKATEIVNNDPIMQKIVVPTGQKVVNSDLGQSIIKGASNLKDNIIGSKFTEIKGVKEVVSQQTENGVTTVTRVTQPETKTVTLRGDEAKFYRQNNLENMSNPVIELEGTQRVTVIQNDAAGNLEQITTYPKAPSKASVESPGDLTSKFPGVIESVRVKENILNDMPLRDPTVVSSTRSAEPIIASLKGQDLTVSKSGPTSETTITATRGKVSLDNSFLNLGGDKPVTVLKKTVVGDEINLLPKGSSAAREFDVVRIYDKPSSASDLYGKATGQPKNVDESATLYEKVTGKVIEETPVNPTESSQFVNNEQIGILKDQVNTQKLFDRAIVDKAAFVSKETGDLSGPMKAGSNDFFRSGLKEETGKLPGEAKSAKAETILDPKTVADVTESLPRAIVSPVETTQTPVFASGSLAGIVNVNSKETVVEDTIFISYPESGLNTPLDLSQSFVQKTPSLITPTNLFDTQVTNTDNKIVDVALTPDVTPIQPNPVTPVTPFPPQPITPTIPDIPTIPEPPSNKVVPDITPVVTPITTPSEIITRITISDITPVITPITTPTQKTPEPILPNIDLKFNSGLPKLFYPSGGSSNPFGGGSYPFGGRRYYKKGVTEYPVVTAEEILKADFFGRKKKRKR